MGTYIFRRVLLMIPTLFGISMVVWLVMALAPGRPGDQAGGGALGGDTDQLQKDPLKEADANEAQRNFRRQFGLDRPKFWNDWWDLETETVRADVEVANLPVDKVGVERKREATERLEDYGKYAVPPLIALLQTTEGEEQSHILYWLRRSAVRTPPKTPGRELDDADIAIRREMALENQKLKRLVWTPQATPAERAEVVAKWVDWYEEKRPERFEWGAWDKVKVTLVDTQFGTYWSRLLKGDLGTSHIHKRPVVDLVLERMKYTLSLNVVALVIAYLLAVPLGIFSAVKQGTIADKTIGVILFMLYSLPNFFVGTLLLQWLATGEGGGRQWFPISGFESEDANLKLNTFAHLKDILWHITLPLVCLSYGGLAVLSRYSRTGMLDVIRSDYVRTARAKGLSEWTVIVKHVVRNGILPIVTILGTSLPILISGSVAIEWIFGINGMGLLIIESIFAKDFNVIMGVQLIVAVLTMVGILLSDIAYAVLDPRISLS